MTRSAAAERLPATPQREFAYGLDDFREIARLLEERTGIHLPEHKDQLVYSRLAKRLRALGLDSFQRYRALLAAPEGREELLRMVNALTTNLTRFFREPHHLAHLRDQLGRLAAQGPCRIRLWSAGCSTGQEAYSMALVLRAAIPDLTRFDARILATDIDTDVLATAARGLYDADDVAEVPAEYRRHLAEAGGGKVEVAREVRDLVAFKPLNLIGPWPFKGPFDAIFCRNVAIYFTPETQTRMFGRFHEMLGPRGVLHIGHSETLNLLADRFELVGQTTYRPR